MGETVLLQMCEDSEAGGASNRQLEMGILGSDGNRTEEDKDLGTIHTEVSTETVGV